MKGILLSMTFITCLQLTVKSQYVNIPDSSFKVILKSLHPDCFNGSDMMDTTCSGIVNETILFVPFSNIKSLEGVQFFKSLQSLTCYENKLTSLPKLSSSLNYLNCRDNQLTFLPELPDSLVDLQCGDNQLTTLPALGENVNSLGCANNFLTTLPDLPVAMAYLTCDYNPITVLPPFPLYVKGISCSNCNLSTLPDVPFMTQYLYCGYNQLTSLPLLPSLLTSLYCDHNQLSILPELPPNVNVIFCNSNLLTELPALPSGLYFLQCDTNRLSTLPVLPANIGSIYCSNNQITTLPDFPLSLTYFDCRYNQLSSLPVLPANLSDLLCDYNRLTSLPTLNDTLQHLYCSHNRLRFLPVLSSSLKELDCSFNQLTDLPVLPTMMYMLDCSHNYLTSLPQQINQGSLYCEYNQLSGLPAIPQYLYTIHCNNNPLSCMPLLPNTLMELNIKNTNLSCIPNITSATIDTVLPICGLTGVCDVNAFVQGRILIDTNSLHNSGDTVLSQQIVTVSPNNWIGVSDLNGVYVVKLDTLISNSWTAVNNYKYATITPPSYTLSNIHALGLIQGSYDFYVHFIPDVRDLQVALASLSRVRPGFSIDMTLGVLNVGTVSQSDVIVKFKKPTGFDVLNTSVAPDYISDDTLIWTNVSIAHLSNQSFHIQLQIPADLPISASTVFEAWVNGMEGDSTPTDNYVLLSERSTGSFDPNEKLVNTDHLLPSYDANKDKLLYTIRFQNTGTDTAFTVIVRDVIPDNLDVTSLRVVNASHPYQLIVREKNIVEVAFPNIQLPDSNVNEPNSHGFVQLEFKPKSGLPVNAEIKNNASILFDYNAPVITNTATTRIQIVTGVSNNKKLAFQMFPNPASQMVHIKLPYEGSGKWMVSDITGKIIRQDIFSSTTGFDIALNSIPSGTYLFSIQMQDVTSTSKIVVAR